MRPLFLLFLGFTLSGRSPAVFNCPKTLSALAKPASFEAWVRQTPAHAVGVSETVPSYPLLVIGAGPAGLAAMAELKRQGVPFEAVERHSRVGGVWDQSHPDSPAYDSLTTNSSRATTHLGKPLPPDLPAYMHHSQVHAYLTHFAREQELEENIRFGTSVEKVTRSVKGTWNVTFRQAATGELYEREYRGLVIAAGINNKQNRAYPRELWEAAHQNGMGVLHASDYRNATPFAQKRVLIVGIGNSGAEIATEVSPVAARTVVAVRTTPWIVPLWVLGRPADEFAGETPSFVPHWLEMAAFHALQRWYVGHPSRLGFQPPSHRSLERLPISDRGIAKALRERRVIVRSPVSSIKEGRVEFTDPRHEAEAFDVAIFATGYRRRYPFLSTQYADFTNPSFSLPFLIFHPTEAGLTFLSEPIVPQSAWPLFVEQAKAIAAYYAAEARNRPNVTRFNRLRTLPGPNAKGHLFRGADDFHVDPHIYTRWLRQLSDWLKEE